MTLKEHIDDICDNLEKGVFINEAAVCDYIVRRLLVDALDWPRHSPNVVIREYEVEGRRVDFALCDPPLKPRVFIEVKKVGNIEGGEKQLFQYAFHEGIPIAILTDGQRWQFFHPTAQGDYRERKVHEMDLTASASEESAKRFDRYLNYESICTGEAAETIKKDYEKVVQQRQIEASLPKVWNELVEEKNEDLLLVMMDAAKNKIGYEPTEEQVLNFLKSLERKIQSPVENTPSPPIPSVQPLSTPRRGLRTQKAPQTRLAVTMPNGEKIEYPKAIDTWIEVIMKLGPDRVIEVDNGQIISTSPNFRPDRPEEQFGQYYIAKDYGTSRKKQLLEGIAKRLDVNMKVEIVNKS